MFKVESIGSPWDCCLWVKKKKKEGEKRKQSKNKIFVNGTIRGAGGLKPWESIM